MIDPKIIQKFTATGVGDMGDVTKIEAGPRFSLDVDFFVLAYIRALFSGGTSTKANMVWRISHRSRPTVVDASGVGSFFDFKPITFEDCGTGGETAIEFRVPDDQLRNYRLDRDPVTRIVDEWVPEWTNPDNGNMRWAIEIGLIDAGQIYNLQSQIDGRGRVRVPS